MFLPGLGRHCRVDFRIAGVEVINLQPFFDKHPGTLEADTASRVIIPDINLYQVEVLR